MATAKSTNPKPAAQHLRFRAKLEIVWLRLSRYFADIVAEEADSRNIGWWLR